MEEAGAEKMPARSGESARVVFLAWKLLRVVYNAVLVAVVLVSDGSSLGDRAFWLFLAYGAALANVCFCLGPVIEGYVSLFGADRRLVRWVVFVPGTLFGCLLAYAALFSWGLRGLD